MLEENLDVLPFWGERLESPINFDELCREYFHAASIKAKPHNGHDPSQDISKVLTLRPTASPPYVTRRVEKAKHRGYFAWGRQEDGDVIFEIFAPHSSVKSKFPPRQLETAVALFAVRLNQEGYNLPAKSIEYSTHIKG